jgi:hypothetical protein
MEIQNAILKLISKKVILDKEIIMKLKPDEKFILPDDDGNLILITELDFSYEVLQNRIIPMKGVKFNVDYENNKIETKDEINIQTSFSIDCMYGKEDE